MDARICKVITQIRFYELATQLVVHVCEMVLIMYTCRGRANIHPAYS